MQASRSLYILGMNLLLLCGGTIAAYNECDNCTGAGDYESAIDAHMTCDDAPKQDAEIIEFLQAAEQGDITRVKGFLESGVDSNIKSMPIGDGDVKTPLLAAVKNDKIDMVIFLLDHGADLNATDYLPQTEVCYERGGRTALHWAAFSGNSAMVLLLINRGATIDTKDSAGYTPLLLAVRRNKESIVTLLLQHGAYLDSTDNDGLTPLMHACMDNNLTIVKEFCTRKMAINTQDDRGRSALMYAVNNPKTDTTLIELLIKHGADVNARDALGITAFVLSLHTEAFFKLLYAAGADIHTKTDAGDTTLSLAAMESFDNATNFLIARGADVNHRSTDTGMTALHYAARQNNLTTIKILLDKSADGNAENLLGYTPLMIATMNGHKESVELLLTKKVMVDKADTSGETPLMCAARNNDITIAQLLCSYGANVNYQNEISPNDELYTPLIAASACGNEAMVNFLIGKGANATTKDHLGRSSFFYAVQSGDLSTVQRLYTDNHDLTAIIRIADMHGYQDIVAFLVDQYKLQHSA